MITVVKIGGNVVDNEQALEKFCSDFAALEGPKVLVHGGGVMASAMMRQLGQEPKMVNGRRVTDAEALKVTTMVYSGWCNKHIVSLLQADGCNAMGLSGCDANAIVASRRAPLDGIDYGFVGDVTAESVNTNLIKTLIDNGITPVFCAINHDAKGNLLNTNADTIAQSLSAALKARMVYCFELPGVLKDKDDPQSVIKSISKAEFETMKADGTISGGMIPKIENALKALSKGAVSCVIKSSEALKDGNAGSEISL